MNNTNQTQATITEQDWAWWCGLTDEWKGHLLIAVGCQDVEYEYDDNDATIIWEKMDCNNKTIITPYLSQIKQLTELDLSNKGITDISPLAYLVHLESLTFYTDDIRDISPLLNLTKLKKITFGLVKNRRYSPTHFFKKFNPSFFNN